MLYITYKCCSYLLVNYQYKTSLPLEFECDWSDCDDSWQIKKELVWLVLDFKWWSVDITELSLCSSYSIKSVLCSNGMALFLWEHFDSLCCFILATSPTMSSLHNLHFALIVLPLELLISTKCCHTGFFLLPVELIITIHWTLLSVFNTYQTTNNTLAYRIHQQSSITWKLWSQPSASCNRLPAVRTEQIVKFTFIITFS